MKKKNFSSIIFTGLLICTLGTFASPPTNIHEAKKGLIAYHDSGQYQKDIQNITDYAMRYVDKRIAQNHASAHPKKLAAVFDIDETVLSNYQNLVRMHFGGTAHEWDLIKNAGNDKAIKPVKQFYDALKAKGVTIFFVTGRASNLRAATVKNLKTAGFTGYKGLYLKPANYPYRSYQPYKTSVRQKITKMGYDIILTMGDQWSDLNGGYAEQAFKLPDPFYYSP